MMPLIATDLPLPVEPAINKCGILAKSAVIKLPETSRPIGTSKGLLESFFCEEIMSLNDIVATFLLGTSIPINDLPGIGASIRISLAANAKARSSAKLTILLTLTPIAG